MRRFSSVAVGLLLGLVFSLALNVGSFLALKDGRLNVASLGASIHSADEVYYFALIRDVRDGHWNLGNASIREYWSAPSVAGYALIPQGFLARFTNWSIETVVLIGDIFFPLLICAVLFLIARTVIVSELTSAFFALAFMAWWGPVWLRTMNPQVTMLAFALGFLFILQERRLTERGAMLSVLLFVQPIYALFIGIVELLLGLTELWREKSAKFLVRRIGMILCFAVALGIQLWLQYVPDLSIFVDTYARRGLIESHLPTAPVTQVVILLLLLVAFVRRRHRAQLWIDTVMVLSLVAGLVVLNQSIIHGKDAVFGLYYRMPLSLVLWLAVAWTLRPWMKSRYQIILAGVLAAWCIASMALLMSEETVPSIRNATSDFGRSPISLVMDDLNKLEPGRVIFASIEISNLVPVFTPHYPFFTQYAHFEYAPDKTLAERYLVQQEVFPMPDEMRVEGDPLVFGIYAGNKYARAKTLCRLKKMIGGTENCDALKFGDFMLHPDIYDFVQKGEVDTLTVLRRAKVNTVVTDQALPKSIAAACKKRTDVRPYSIYDCKF